jgi:hypothetical protein
MPLQYFLYIRIVFGYLFEEGQIKKLGRLLRKVNFLIYPQSILASSPPPPVLLAKLRLWLEW